MQRWVRSPFTIATGLLWGCSTLSGLDDFSVASTAAGGAGGGASMVSSSTNGGGGVVPALEDEGLVARYFLDEGSSSTVVTDAASAPVDLSLVVDEMEQPELVGTAGRRALQWPDASSEGRAWIASVDDTKLYERLHDAETATLEMVVRLLDVDPQASRLLHFGVNTSPGRLSLRMETPGELELYVNDNPIAIGEMPMNQRVVVHGVFEAPNVNRPAQLYVDGRQVTLSLVAVGDPINLGGCHFAIGNRLSEENDGRSPRGRIHYAAVYDVAFTPSRVAAHAAHLLENDDTPQ